MKCNHGRVNDSAGTTCIKVARVDALNACSANRQAHFRSVGPASFMARRAKARDGSDNRIDPGLIEFTR